MMDKASHWPRRPRSMHVDLRSGVAGAAGGLVMVLALLACIAIAVIFAATLAVVTALATVLFGLSALAWRMRPRAVVQRSVVVQPRGGHAWVEYTLERPRRG